MRISLFGKLTILLLSGLTILFSLTSCGMVEDDDTCDASIRASGYLLSSTCRPLSWGENLPVKLHFGTTLSPDAQFAIKEAIDIWNKSTGKTLFELVGTYDDNPQNPIGPYINVIGMRSKSEWGKCSENDLICGKEDEPAKTLYRYKQFIYNANVFFYNEYPFSANGDTNSYDLISIALHELGHVLGLDHDDSTNPDVSVMNSRIYKGTTRQLTQRDIDRVRALYPF